MINKFDLQAMHYHLEQMDDDELNTFSDKVDSLVRIRKLAKDERRLYEADTGLLAAERAGYEDGFRTGVSWPDKWEHHGKPGGPWVLREKSIKGIRSQRVNDKWRQGWEDGHEQKRKIGWSISLEEHIAFMGK